MTDTNGRILLVDDDPIFAKVFTNELRRLGFSVTQGYGEDIVSLINSNSIDVAIVDIVMPDLNGIDLLRSIKGHYPSLDVIMLTGNATIENAVSSMKEGAYDYFTKPVELNRVQQVLHKCLENRRLKEKNKILKNKISDLQDGRLIGSSPAIEEVRRLISRFADSDSTVLIQGESGTGKELVANVIHKNSARREEPFLVVDCTALKEHLLESELFGHERGAFTDAVMKKHGILEVADGGTVFLDEIGDVPLSLQAKLLRVVETKGFRRLGGNERIDVDVRFISATNRDLREMVAGGEFREDLYYRLNVINITLPPLRELLEDIPPLVDHFLEEICGARGRRCQITPEALEVMKQHSWPGNVRELRNVVERCVILSDMNVIGADDLPLKPNILNRVMAKRKSDELPSLDELNRDYIEWVLKKVDGNKKQAAKLLKIDRKTLARKLRSEENDLF